MAPLQKSSGMLDPLLGLSNVSTFHESSSSVYSISSTSTKCEFINLSDSDDSSTILVQGSKQVPVAARESHYETAEMYPLGAQLPKISELEFSRELIFSENLRVSQERIQILSGRCSNDSSVILGHGSEQRESNYKTAEMCPLGPQLPKVSEAQFSSELIFSENLRASQERIQILSGRCSGTKTRFSHGSQVTSTPKASRSKPDDIRVSTNVAGCSSAENTNCYATAQEIPRNTPECQNVEKGLFEHLLLEDVLESQDEIDLRPKPVTEKCSTSQKQQSQAAVSLEQLGDCFNVDEERGTDSKRKTAGELLGKTAPVVQKTERRVLEKLSLEPDPKQAQFKELLLPQQTEIVQKQSSEYENEREGNKENIEGNIIRESEEVLALHDIEEDEGQSESLTPKPPEFVGSSENLSDGSVILVNKKSRVRRLSSSSDEEREEEFVRISSAKKKLRLKKRQFILAAKKRVRKCAGTINKRRTEQKTVQDEKLVSECEKKEPRDGQCLVSPKPSVQQCVVLLPRHERLQEIDENSSDASEGSTIGIKTKTKAKQLSPDTDSEDEPVFETVKSPEPAVRQCVVLLPRHVGLEELDKSSSDDSKSGIGIETEAKTKQLSPEAKSRDEAIFEMVNVSLNRQLSASTVEHQTPDHSERHRNCEREFDKLKENLSSILDENHSKYSQETQIHACENQDNVGDDCATKEKAIETIEGNSIIEVNSDFVSAQDIEPVKESETILEREEETRPEANATVFDQTMNTTLRKTRKLYDPDDLTYLENMKDAEEEVPTRQERENVLEKTQQTRTVTKKRQIKYQKAEKPLGKTKKLKVVHPEIMLDIDRIQNPPNPKSGFHKILDELRRDTKTSFAAIINSTGVANPKDNIDETKTKRKRITKKRDNNNNASKNKFENHESVRDLTMADISEVSHRLRKEGRNSENETIFDPLLLCGEEDLVSAVEVPKKINIISDVQIRPKRILLEDTSNKTKKMEPIDNTINDVGEEIPLFSEEVADNNDRRGRRGENGLKTGDLNYNQTISERRIILKHMYRVFKHVLGKPDQSREYRDVLQICKILKKYV